MGGFLAGLLLAAFIFSATPPYEEFSRDTVLVEILKTETGRKLGHGSGAVLEDGRILTAGHVSDRVSKNPDKFHLRVTYRDGTTTAASVVKQAWDWEYGTSINEDISLLEPRFPNEAMDGASIDCDPVKPGKEVFVSGNPNVMRWAVTDGRVMGKDPRVKMDKGTDGSQWLQIDGTVVGGNSGGPVFTQNGEIVGIVSHGMVQGRSPVGLNFAVSGPVICDFLDYQEPHRQVHNMRGGR